MSQALYQTVYTLISHLGCSTTAVSWYRQCHIEGAANRIMKDLAMCHIGTYDVTLRVQQLGPSDVYMCTHV